LEYVRKLSDPTSKPSWHSFAELAARWNSRWPSLQQGSSAAALTVINTRDIILQSVAAELGKFTQIPHKVNMNYCCLAVLRIVANERCM